MSYLYTIDFQNRGDMSGLLTRPVERTKPVLGAFVWMDWNMRYFIFTGVSMEKGRPYAHGGGKKTLPQMQILIWLS